MNIRRTGVTLLAATGVAALLLAGVAAANPMGGGMGGTTGTTMMQPGGGMGGTTGTTMMQPTSTTMMQPGGGMGGTTSTTLMQPGGGMGQGHMFSDVATGDWFAEMAENMASHDFMGGFTDGTFGPDRPLTRGQFAGIMARMMDVQPISGTSFSDTEGFWGQGMIEAMTQMGIITGHADGTFGPYDTITREQMAAIMDRAWQVKHGSATPADMTAAMATMRGRLADAGSSWAADHIAWMMRMGVINGDGFGMFRPDDMTNRAEASAMMWRWFEADRAQS